MASVVVLHHVIHVALHLPSLANNITELFPVWGTSARTNAAFLATAILASAEGALCSPSVCSRTGIIARTTGVDFCPESTSTKRSHGHHRDRATLSFLFLSIS